MATRLALGWLAAFVAGIAAADSLRVGVVNLPASYGDPFRAVGIPGALVWQQIFDGLTEIDAMGQPVPALAESFELLEDNVWRFVLRREIRFANGRPFNAAAAKAVFDWLASDAGRASLVGNELKGISKVIVVDERTLDIHTRSPDPILPRRLTAVMMVEPVHWRELGPKGFAQQPVGTGAYQLQRWRTAEGSARLTANPHAWRAPTIKDVEVFPLSEHASRFQAAISGQLDAVMSLRPEQLDAFERRGFRILIDPTKQILGLAFDVVGHSASAIGDVRVRQAINYAVDVDAIARVITNNTARPAGQGAFPGVFGYDPAIDPYPYDPKRAKELLAAAGFPQGFAMTATVVVGTYANDVEFYAKVQQDLNAVGIELELQATVFSDWITQYVTGQWRTEAFSLGWNVSPYHDAQRPMEYFSCLKSNPFFCDPTMTPLINAAAAQMQPSQREATLRSLARRFHEAAPSLYLIQYGHIWAISESVQGFELQDRVPAFHRVEWAQ